MLGEFAVFFYQVVAVSKPNLLGAKQVKLFCPPLFLLLLLFTWPLIQENNIQAVTGKMIQPSPLNSFDT